MATDIERLIEAWSDPEVLRRRGSGEESQEQGSEEQVRALLGEPDRVLDSPAAEVIVGNICEAFSDWLWYSSVPAGDCAELMRLTGNLFFAAAARGISESQALAWFWDRFVYSTCEDSGDPGPGADFREPRICAEILRTIEFVLRLPNATCQFAALNGLKGFPAREVRRVLDNCGGLLVDDDEVRAFAAGVRGRARERQGQ